MENDSGETSYDEVDSELDPRIQVELENLNTATDEINKLEIELDEANTTFRMLLSESTRRLKLLSKKLGSCIERARPYYEAVEVAKKAQQECQKAAVLFQRANEIHAAAKETVALAEQRFMSNQHEWQFDNAWQEMLNHATIKVMDAENQKAASGREHQMRATLFQAAEQKVQQLEEKLRRHIIKSRPYFEEKTLCQDQLNTQKKRIEFLEKSVTHVKFSYSQSLKKLELISEEIHQKRKRNQKNEILSQPRQPGVGCELNNEYVKPSLPDINFELDRCDVHSLGTLSGPASSAVSEKDEEEEEDDVEDDEIVGLKHKVKQLAIRPIDGGEGCSFDNVWESELNATVDKLDHMLLMKECAEQLNNFKFCSDKKEFELTNDTPDEKNDTLVVGYEAERKLPTDLAGKCSEFENPKIDTPVDKSDTPKRIIQTLNITKQSDLAGKCSEFENPKIDTLVVKSDTPKRIIQTLNITKPSDLAGKLSEFENPKIDTPIVNSDTPKRIIQTLNVAKQSDLAGKCSTFENPKIDTPVVKSDTPKRIIQTLNITEQPDLAGKCSAFENPKIDTPVVKSDTPKRIIQTLNIAKQSDLARKCSAFENPKIDTPVVKSDTPKRIIQTLNITEQPDLTGKCSAFENPKIDTPVVKSDTPKRIIQTLNVENLQKMDQCLQNSTKSSIELLEKKLCDS